MSTPQQDGQLPDNVKKEQEKLSKNLDASQELLESFRKSVKESQKFNEKALEYLTKSARDIKP